MSSTNRGGKREVSDYYITPAEHISAFLAEFLHDLVVNSDPVMESGEVIKVLDPCAGGDAKHDMAYPSVLRNYGDNAFKVTTMDIRPDSRATVKGDYLATPINFKPDWIITNPPFSHAQQIIEKALREVKFGGYVIMLLRLNFLGTQGRKEFFRQHMPARIYVHSSRMCFFPEGVTNLKTGRLEFPTDSIEYAHFVWQGGVSPASSVLKVIDAK